jgi:hypothetical protein
MADGEWGGVQFEVAAAGDEFSLLFLLFFTRELCQIAVLPPDEQRSVIVPVMPKEAKTDRCKWGFDPKLQGLQTPKRQRPAAVPAWRLAASL